MGDIDVSGPTEPLPSTENTQNENLPVHTVESTLDVLDIIISDYQKPLEERELTAATEGGWQNKVAAILAAYPPFNIVAGKQVATFNLITSASYLVMYWALKRVAEGKSSQQIIDLAVLQLKTTPIVEQVIALKGVKVHERYDISEGMYVCPAADIAEYPTRSDVFGSNDVSEKMSALVIRVNYSPFFFRYARSKTGR